jgi:hypothetical protein
VLGLDGSPSFASSSTASLVHLRKRRQGLARLANGEDTVLIESASS